MIPTTDDHDQPAVVVNQRHRPLTAAFEQHQHRHTTTSQVAVAVASSPWIPIHGGRQGEGEIEIEIHRGGEGEERQGRNRIHIFLLLEPLLHTVGIEVGHREDDQEQEENQENDQAREDGDYDSDDSFSLKHGDDDEYNNTGYNNARTTRIITPEPDTQDINDTDTDADDCFTITTFITTTASSNRSISSEREAEFNKEDGREEEEAAKMMEEEIPPDSHSFSAFYSNMATRGLGHGHGTSTMSSFALSPSMSSSIIVSHRHHRHHSRRSSSSTSSLGGGEEDMMRTPIMTPYGSGTEVSISIANELVMQEEQDLININISQASQPHSQSYSHTIAKGIGAWLPAPLERPAQMTTPPVQTWSEMTMTNGGSGEEQQNPGLSAIYEMLQLVEGHRDEMYAERWMLAGSGSGTSVGGSRS